MTNRLFIQRFVGRNDFAPNPSTQKTERSVNVTLFAMFMYIMYVYNVFNLPCHLNTASPSTLPGVTVVAFALISTVTRAFFANFHFSGHLFHQFLHGPFSMHIPKTLWLGCCVIERAGREQYNTDLGSERYVSYIRNISWVLCTVLM